MNSLKLIAMVFVVFGLSACSIDKESMSMFLAKEMCSCRYLVGQSEKNCRDAIRPSLAVGDVTMDDAKKEATGRAEDGSHPATFRFVSSKFGCELKN